MSISSILSRTYLSNIINSLISIQKFSNTSSLNKIFSITANEEFMDKVMSSSTPVIVNFHAEWCEPCKILTPKLRELVEPLLNVDLAIINVEEMPEMVHTFEVKAVPAVLAVRNGVIVDKFIGLVDSSMIENLINKLITK